jgi:hypothetical protein
MIPLSGLCYRVLSSSSHKPYETRKAQQYTLHRRSTNRPELTFAGAMDSQ